MAPAVEEEAGLDVFLAMFTGAFEAALEEKAEPVPGGSVAVLAVLLEKSQEGGPPLPCMYVQCFFGGDDWQQEGRDGKASKEGAKLGCDNRQANS